MDPSNTRAVRDRMNSLGAKREKYARRNWYYYGDIRRFMRAHVSPGSRVLEVGCGTGNLLASLEPSVGVGIDVSDGLLRIARGKHPHLRFVCGDAHRMPFAGRFDYVILSDSIGYFEDIQQAMREIAGVCDHRTRVIVTYYNTLWLPILKFGELIGWKMPDRYLSWLPLQDMENLLALGGLAVFRRGIRLLFPLFFPLLSWFLNRIVTLLPFVRHLCLVQWCIARVRPSDTAQAPLRGRGVSVIVPCRNEQGNIEAAVRRIPDIGAWTEIIFVEGGSQDGTREEIERQISLHPERDLRLVLQGEGFGKGDAVRKGFAAARGDVLMILDADLTMPPEDLPKFYDALSSGRAEFANGSRLVYPMEKQSMRFLNYLGNKFFGAVFTWILGQRIRDTLCGTKALFCADYERIAERRASFGMLDPFGDFDLILGAGRLDLEFVEIPIRYRARRYGETQISRFRHGWMLLRMSWLAFRKLKF